MELRKKLLHLMTEKGWTQIAVSSKSGVSQSAISDYVNEENPSRPRGNNALKLAKIFGVPLEWLLDDKQDWPPPHNKRLLAPKIEIIQETEEEYIIRIKKRC